MKMTRALIFCCFCIFAVSSLADELLPATVYAVDIKPLPDDLKRAEWGAHCDFTHTMPDGKVSHIAIYSDMLARYIKETQLSAATITFSQKDPSGPNLPFMINDKHLTDFVIPGRILFLFVNDRRYIVKAPSLE